MRLTEQKRFLITGANGFVGKSLCTELLRQRYYVRAAVRSANVKLDELECEIVGDLDGKTEWGNALAGMDVVIHLAARVHVMQDASSDPLESFRKVNVEATEHLARSAAASGVKRFVYVSSIKVNGESTLFLPASEGAASHSVKPSKKDNQVDGNSINKRGWEFTESNEPDPQDPYGVSKWEAEQALHQVSTKTGMEVVIVRPPLVYGKGVKGNFAQMLRILAKGIPLPLASVQNSRSLIYVGNLVDALILCATHPSAKGETYLLNDGEDVSTPDLLRRLGSAMGHPARLLPCPPALLKLLGMLTGRTEQIERLLGSLKVDSSKIRRELGWSPPFTLQQGLCKTVMDRNKS